MKVQTTGVSNPVRWLNFSSAMWVFIIVCRLHLPFVFVHSTYFITGVKIPRTFYNHYKFNSFNTSLTKFILQSFSHRLKKPSVYALRPFTSNNTSSPRLPATAGTSFCRNCYLLDQIFYTNPYTFAPCGDTYTQRRLNRAFAQCSRFLTAAPR